MPSRHWLYFGGFVVSGILLVGAGVMGLIEGSSALAGGAPASEESMLVTMLAAAAEWIGIVLVLGLIAILFLVATVVSVLRSASLPRDDRLVTAVEWLERQYPLLRKFEVSEKVEPTTEDRRQRLKEQYVTGEISETEFEREMERLMDDTDSEGASLSDTERTLEVDDEPR
jgi:uncharacterized membrane protein